MIIGIVIYKKAKNNSYNINISSFYRVKDTIDIKKTTTSEFNLITDNTIEALESDSYPNNSFKNSNSNTFLNNNKNNRLLAAKDCKTYLNNCINNDRCTDFNSCIKKNSKLSVCKDIKYQCTYYDECVELYACEVYGVDEDLCGLYNFYCDYKKYFNTVNCDDRCKESTKPSTSSTSQTTSTTKPDLSNSIDYSDSSNSRINQNKHIKRFAVFLIVTACFKIISTIVIFWDIYNKNYYGAFTFGKTSFELTLVPITYSVTCCFNDYSKEEELFTLWKVKKETQYDSTKMNIFLEILGTFICFCIQFGLSIVIWFYLVVRIIVFLYEHFGENPNQIRNNGTNDARPINNNNNNNLNVITENNVTNNNNADIQNNNDKKAESKNNSENNKNNENAPNTVYVYSKETERQNLNANSNNLQLKTSKGEIINVNLTLQLANS